MSRCVKCKNHFNAGEVIVPCSCCGGLFHGTMECTGVTASEQRVFLLKQSILVYRCVKCTQQGGNSTFVNAVAEFKESIGDLLEASRSIKTLVNDVEIIKEKIADIDPLSEEIASLREDVTRLQQGDPVDVSAFKTELNELKAEIESVMSAVDNLPTMDGIENEIQARLSRSKNVVLYNVSEASPEVDSVTTADLAAVRVLLGEINNINSDAISVRRLGKPSRDVNRPLVVTLSSRAEVFRILAARKKLPIAIKVSTDKTRMQRENLRKLYSMVEEHNKVSDKKLWVKYENGVPKAVNVDEKNSSRRGNDSRRKKETHS